eukprot:SAG31_NODE_10854_length_1090_cov_0.889001_1_plen_203_part_01
MAAEGRFVVEGCRLQQGNGESDPLPCDGKLLGHCEGPHVGAVTVPGPGAVTAGAPLLCNAGPEGECQPLLSSAMLAAGVTVSQFNRGLADGIDTTADPMCFLQAGEYLTVPDDESFLTSAEEGIRCDGFQFPGDDIISDARGPFGLGQHGSAWYRLPEGKQLATSRPENYCSTSEPGSLSGWPATSLVAIDIYFIISEYLFYN